VNLARGGICGTDSVNCLRGQDVLRHNHFCLHHSRFGKSGPTFTSFGRVTTQPLDRVETTEHCGHRPTHACAVNTRTSRVPPAPTPSDEFVVLCQDLHHPGEAQLIARRLELAVTEPFDLPGGRVAITASVGVAFADPRTR